jgi:lysozyme family protein
MVTIVTIILIVLVVTFVQYKGTLYINTNSVSAVKRNNLRAPAYTHVEGEKGVCWYMEGIAHVRKVL